MTAPQPSYQSAVYRRCEDQGVGDAVAYDARAATNLNDVTYDLRGRIGTSRLRILKVAGQRLHECMIDRRSFRGEQHWPLFAGKVIWQDEMMEIVREDQVASRTRIVPGE
jgi:hypothetical protein